MYKQLRKVVTEHIDSNEGFGLNLLAIGGSTSFAHYISLGKADITAADYPEINMLSLPMGDNQFDVVVSDQVLEHVEGDPFTAVRESIRVAKPGGYIVHTTCFFNAIHPAPRDFWRFTPDALNLMCNGIADPIEVNGWGNLALLPVTRLGLRFRPVPDSWWHPLHWVSVRNNPLWPVTTWIVARKPRSAER
jgi:SAM-dependent methyltransferase